MEKSEYLDMILQTKNWYEDKLLFLQSIIDLDEDKKIMVVSSDDDSIELPEAHRTGFILGLITAVDYLGKFPINIKKNI